MRITLNVNGIRSADAQGPRRTGSPRSDAVGRRAACRRSRPHVDDVPDAACARPPALHAAFHPRASARATAGVGALRADAPAPRRRGLRRARVRRRGPLPRGATSASSRRGVGLPAVGLGRRAPAGVQVPLPRGVPAAPARRCARRGKRGRPVRRLEHRAPARST
ncbi:MAG: hypothetical protein MZW92_44200 [Comamonadaceae bacterium]|nr:hypothetical protein [Comamonadaceae bacterium]